MSTPPPPPPPPPPPGPYGQPQYGQQPYQQGSWPGAPSSSTPPQRRARFTVPAILAILGSAALVAGSFLSWVELESPFGPVGDVNGLDGDGVITLICGGLALLLFLLGAAVGTPVLHTIAVVFSGLGAAVAIYDIVNVSNELSDENLQGFGTASVGIGLYVCAAGAVVAVLAGLAAAVMAAKRT